MKTPSIILFNKPSETEKFDKEKFLNSLKQFGEFDSKIVDEGLKELSQFPELHYSRLIELGIKSFKNNEDAKKYFERYQIEESVSFERLRRITGYLVGSLDRWNDGKKAEEAARVKHTISEKQKFEELKKNEKAYYGKI